MPNYGNTEYPRPVFTAAGTANRTCTSVGATASIPAAATYGLAATQAHGIIPPTGLVTVEVSAPTTIQINLYSQATKQWLPPGVSSTQYQKIFSAAGFDFFTARPGELFLLSQTVAAAVTCYTDAPAVPTNPAGL